MKKGIIFFILLVLITVFIGNIKVNADDSSNGLIQLESETEQSTNDNESKSFDYSLVDRINWSNVLTYGMFAFGGLVFAMIVYFCNIPAIKKKKQREAAAREKQEREQQEK